MTTDSKIERGDRDLAKLLSRGLTYGDAATALGISETTVYRRMRDSASLREAVDRERHANVDRLVDRLDGVALTALEVLERIATDPAETASTRAKAAAHILGAMARAHDLRFARERDRRRADASRTESARQLVADFQATVSMMERSGCMPDGMPAGFALVGAFADICTPEAATDVGGGEYELLLALVVEALGHLGVAEDDAETVAVEMRAIVNERMYSQHSHRAQLRADLD